MNITSLLKRKEIFFLKGKSLILRMLFLLSLSFISTDLNASVVIGATRLYFTGTMDNVDVKVRNTGDKPFLIISKVTDESERGKNTVPGKIRSFNVVPPAFSIKGNGERLIRITKGDLSSAPTDRESLYYLSVAAIPQGGQAENSVQIAVRSWIKLIFRPESIKKFNVNDVKFFLRDSVLNIKNESPYYVSIPYLNANNDVFPKNISIAPLSGIELNTCRGSGACNVRFRLLNEDGSASEEQEILLERG
ncbi:molecular chaperone (plasmid) [Enterobacter sp. D2]|uniref:fimbrial biogenesis chaperone n=1 Tax=Enterobacter sp. D2 TaxID=3102784 RepID=UPI002ACA90C1|nr:molecular chaperone [Enterobacter sp. D2]MDZ5731143.1 molecular chaperone [Enterobacter sp. D2]